MIQKQAGSGETETTEGGTKKPKRFRPKKLMKKMSAALMGSGKNVRVAH